MKPIKPWQNWINVEFTLLILICLFMIALSRKTSLTLD